MGTYKKKDKLGVGAYGEVWLAEHNELAQLFAVKYVPIANIRKPAPRIFDEPQLLVTLAHPHIVKVYDAGRLGTSEIYIAMEYVPGGTLKKFLNGKVMD